MDKITETMKVSDFMQMLGLKEETDLLSMAIKCVMVLKCVQKIGCFLF